MKKILPYLLAIALGVFIYLYIVKPTEVITDSTYQEDMDSLSRVIAERNIVIQKSDEVEDSLLVIVARQDSTIKAFDSIHHQAIIIYENEIADINSNSIDDDLGFFAREYANRKRD